jgi:hypothetical protein
MHAYKTKSFESGGRVLSSVLFFSEILISKIISGRSSTLQLFHKFNFDSDYSVKVGR